MNHILILYILLGVLLAVNIYLLISKIKTASSLKTKALEIDGFQLKVENNELTITPLK